TATNGTISGFANVDVVVGVIDHIIVTPNPVTVTVGDLLAFTATAYDQLNNIISGVDFVWTTDVGTVDATGLFTAQTTPGTGTVTASNGTVSDSAVVDVVLGGLDHIVVSPDPASIIVGGTQSFTAIACDALNNVIPGVGFIWTTDVGSIDASGFFTAQTTPGTGTVTATNGTVSGPAVVNVLPGPLDHIIVTPDPANVTVDGNLQFIAEAFDVYNNVIPGVGFIWNTDVGTIDASGMFTAQSVPGTGTVTATNGTESGLASVNVILATIDHIVVIPDPVTIVVDGTQAFMAVAFDQFNNVIFGVDFVWTTDVGTVDANGFFTAQTSTGLGVVTAANGTINYSATVTVIPGPIDHIIVTPDPVTLTVGDSQLFTATAYDIYNNTIP
ncbi:MAG: hypothetical protein KAX31_01625, partial [Thermoplasmata archaeon]|nr:hypothetical protein [Thermoplasmata archaeon]